jgi:hypothetical protein
MGTTIKYLLDEPSYLKSIDYIHLLGPIGIWLIERSDIDAEYRALFIRFIRHLYSLRQKTVSKSSLPALYKQGCAILTEMDSMLPFFMNTITQHYLLHLPQWIERLGPLFTYWM